MYKVLTLPQFDKWMSSLRDATTKRRLLTRLRKAQLGNLGDIKCVGEGVYEMREHFFWLASLLRATRFGDYCDAGRW